MMFYPAEMHKITIGVHRRYAAPFLQTIHEEGIIELTPVTGDEHLLHLITPVERDAIRQKLAAAQSRAERAVESLVDLVEGGRGRIAEFFLPLRREPLPVRRQDPASVLGSVLDHDALISEILAFRIRRSAIHERIARLDEIEEHLTLYGCLGEELLPASPSRFITVRAGRIPEGECEDLNALFNEEGIESAIATSVCRCTEEGMIAIVVAHKSAADAVDTLLRSRGFAEFNFGDREGTVSDAKDDLIKEKRSLSLEDEEIVSRMCAIADEHLRQLAAVAEDLALARDRIDAAALAGSTRDLRLYSGWIRRRDLPLLERIGMESAGGTMIYRSVPGEDGNKDVPVAYNHPRWLSPFGFLTSTFAPPRYREVDPTFFIAPILVITFGVMLGDAGYGLLLALVAALLLAGPARYPGTTRDLSLVLFACGLSGIIFGIAQGGIFGDLLPRFFGIAPPFALVDPLLNPIIILTGALIFGIAHLNLGLGIASYSNLREGRVGEMLRKQGVWFLMQPCSAVLLFAFFGWAEFSQMFILAAGAGTAAAAALILFIEGPLGFFSITGFLGDWLSYTRILALALATAGIAMTVNILAEMIGSVHPSLVVVAVLFAIAGHLANFLLQSLGGFIHALRLQYVEFFGTFYEGGGRLFLPFATKRVDTVLVEDE
ncbi:V-type ATP synthase subunit I [Methanocalculus sp.]|uniref:V-type ATP synthase subunit I n=1 Tax=Methanocalculus sp. TaxID=2004547 RepID=UPI00271BDE5A|nr:V-type ATPase 116kDa subunit family protein [Methanocalculus sp.]MDO8842318.1 V-type ATPase 116kDa subunit family protein [Methanocalculus sp.]